MKLLAAVTLLVLAAGVAYWALESGGDSPQHQQVGFNEDSDPRVFGLQASLGMPIRRIRIPWSSVEVSPGAWDWSRYDAEYDALIALGMEPLLVAAGVPCWAHPKLGCEQTAQAPPDPQYEAGWSEYVRRLVARYPDALGVEVWNEPNLTLNFAPHPNPVRFTELLEDAYAAVKEVDPQMPVITGGLFPSDTSGAGGMADAEFLAALFEAGAGESLDAIGAHPYPVVAGSGESPSSYDLAGMEESLRRLRDARDAAGASSTPIWITETGVSTQSAPSAPDGVTEERQSEFLLALLEAVEDDADIPVVVIHRLVDSSPILSAGLRAWSSRASASFASTAPRSRRPAR